MHFTDFWGLTTYCGLIIIILGVDPAWENFQPKPVRKNTQAKSARPIDIFGPSRLDPEEFSFKFLFQNNCISVFVLKFKED